MGLLRCGSVDLSDFVGKLKALYPGIEADEVYPKAIRKGAQLLGDRIQANTPMGKSEYRYQYKGRMVVVKAGNFLDSGHSSPYDDSEGLHRYIQEYSIEYER